MGFTLLDGLVVSTFGVLFWASREQNSYPAQLFWPRQFLLFVEPYGAVHSLKKPHETSQVYQATGSQELIVSSLQILNSCNEYFNIKLMLHQSMNLTLFDMGFF